MLAAAATATCSVALSTGTVFFLLRGPCRRRVMEWFWEDKKEIDWARFPERIIFVRHGESEHNLEHAKIFQEDNPDRKPDNLSELTKRGIQQARDAGKRLSNVLGPGKRISVVVSPYERTQQTLYCLQSTFVGLEVRAVHIDPRVREQEFGNYQRDMGTHRETAAEVGRFWYRRPTGESGADVYDRADSFWESFWQGSLNRHNKDMFTTSADDALLVVTHGLTMRILLMRYFSWSPQTFDAVYNPGNCDMWTLKKVPGKHRYDIAPEDCSPPRLPWASRQVRVVMDYNREEPRAMTLVDYLRLPQPRTANPEEALKQMIPGHAHKLDPSREVPSGSPEEVMKFLDGILAKCEPIDAEDVDSIDWWCGKISPQGAQLRTVNDDRRSSLRTRSEKNFSTRRRMSSVIGWSIVGS